VAVAPHAPRWRECLQPCLRMILLTVPRNCQIQTFSSRKSQHVPTGTRPCTELCRWPPVRRGKPTRRSTISQRYGSEQHHVEYSAVWGLVKAISSVSRRARGSACSVSSGGMTLYTGIDSLLTLIHAATVRCGCSAQRTETMFSAKVQTTNCPCGHKVVMARQRWKYTKFFLVLSKTAGTLCLTDGNIPRTFTSLYIEV
jgi:hypothetical protein